MEDAKEAERVRGVLTVARRQINQQEPDLAIETLRRIKDEVERLPQTREWAEHALLVGEAFTAMHSEAAESFLREARERIRGLPDPAPELD